MISKRNEIVGGVTTFLTMSYIIVVNPRILSTEGTGLAFSAVMTATVILCFSMTLFMGLYARLPFAVALGLVAWAGVAFVLVSATPLRRAIARAVPLHLRQAAAAGIGLFLAFLGL